MYCCPNFETGPSLPTRIRMPNPGSCTDPALLDRLIRGQVPPGEVEPLARHLEGCLRCAETAAGLGGEDTLLAELRAGPPAGAVPAAVAATVAARASRRAADEAAAGYAQGVDPTLADPA